MEMQPFSQGGALFLGKLSHSSSFSPLEGDFSQARASSLTGFWALSMTPSPNHAGVLWPLPDLSLFDPHGHCLRLATPSPPTRAPLSLLQASKAVRLRQLPKHLGLAQREPLTVSLSSSHVPECLVFFPFLRKKKKNKHWCDHVTALSMAPYSSRKKAPRLPKGCWALT